MAGVSLMLLTGWLAWLQGDALLRDRPRRPPPWVSVTTAVLLVVAAALTLPLLVDLAT